MARAHAAAPLAVVRNAICVAALTFGSLLVLLTLSLAWPRTATAVTAHGKTAGMTITVTSPTAASSWPSRSAQKVTWTARPAASSGQFRVWLVSADGHRYLNKQVLPVVARKSYSTSVTASVPPAAGYKACVYWQSTIGSGIWEAKAKSAAFKVTASPAGTVWVDPVNGDDTAAGTSRATALRTLSAAWARVPAGAPLSVGRRILLTPGRFSDGDVPIWFDDRHGTAAPKW